MRKVRNILPNDARELIYADDVSILSEKSIEIARIISQKILGQKDWYCSKRQTTGHLEKNSLKMIEDA